MMSQITMDSLRRSDKVVLTKGEVAAALGVDPRTLTNGIADGTIPSLRLGRRVVIPRERFLAIFDVPSREAS
jgi:excisionase family DNA binding protein